MDEQQDTDHVEFTVGVVAEMGGISIRTLHHYDEIGVLRPSERSVAGYRLYSSADVERLQRILFYRELGFDLGVIATILAEQLSAEDHLRRQRQSLVTRVTRERSMIEALDRELAAVAVGVSLTAHERLAVFGNTRLEEGAAGAERRWGHTPQWDQQRDRTAEYTKDDWLTLRAEQADIHQRLLLAMRAGDLSTDPAVMNLAEEHRLFLDRWFHPCDYRVHSELARAYRANERVGRNFDDMADGLSAYIHDAIVANAERAGYSISPEMT